MPICNKLGFKPKKPLNIFNNSSVTIIIKYHVPYNTELENIKSYLQLVLIVVKDIALCYDSIQRTTELWSLLISYLK